MKLTDRQIMGGLAGRLTASAEPLLLEASSNLKEFAMQRWLYRASFEDEVGAMQTQLSRLAGVSSATGLGLLSEQARDLRRQLIEYPYKGRMLLDSAQIFFQNLLNDRDLVAYLAASDRAFTWFGPSFLEQAARAAELDLYVRAIELV